MEQDRKRYLKKARTVQVFNVVYDIIEVAVSLTAGITAGSSALIAWGLDSIVEVVSAGVLWWRLHGEIEGIEKEQVKDRERITLYVIASSFLIISIFILYDSITALLYLDSARWSLPGIIILVISLFINPVFIHKKYKYGKKLNSKELIADSKDTFVCLYQTIVVLGGLLAVYFLNWWWADSVAALLIVPYALKEGLSAYKNGKKVKS